MTIWDDVRFDECEADLLVLQLAATARALAEAAATLRADLPIVGDEWRGAYRDDFDRTVPALLTTMGGTISTIEGAATLVRIRTEEAAAEQRRLRARVDFIGPVLPG